ncbi:hypothetical protein [Halosegnis longus]|uniref:hypothetical protein n=1 Tax=Halosegnis longus TaxID=2216012 RepID=UPI00129E8AA8|nr:hypothetical protein [Halosegnis longus]
MKSLNVAPIVNNFYSQIYDDRQKSNWEGYILLLVPALIAQIAIFRPIDAEFMSTMSTTLAILFGFTFTSLMSTARYSAKDDKVEEKVVRETRTTTAYALLINLSALVLVVGTTIAVVDYASLQYSVATAVSAGVYFFMFHYLMVMVHLMRYLYLLAIGGAFENSENNTQHTQSEQGDRTPETVHQ